MDNQPLLAEERKKSAPPRVSYRALPSHTTIPFTLLAAYPFLWALYAGLESSYGVSSLSVTGGLALLVFLSNRLARTWHRSQLRLRPLKSVSPVAQNRVTRWMSLLGLKAQVFVSDETDRAHVFQGRLVLPHTLAKRSEAATDGTDEAVILHELAHITTGDSRRLGIIAGMNWIALILVATNLILPIVAGGILILLGQVFGPTMLGGYTRPALVEALGRLGLAVSEANLEILFFVEPSDVVEGLRDYLGLGNIFVLYLILVSIVRSLLQRSCEFLADAFVVDVQRRPDHLRRALTRIAIQLHLHNAGAGSAQQDRQFVLGVHSHRREDSRGSSPIWRWVKTVLARVFPTHPTPLERLEALDSPWKALNMRRTSTSIGLLACLFFLPPPGLSEVWILASTVMIGYFGLANYSVSHVLRGDGAVGHIAKGVLDNVAFVLWGISIGLLLAGINGSLYIILGGMSHPDPHSILPSLGYYVEVGQTLLLGLVPALLVLTLLLVVNGVVTRELLSWYGNPLLTRNPATVFSISSTLVAYCATVGALVLYGLGIIIGRSMHRSTLLFSLPCWWPLFVLAIGWPFIPLLSWGQRYRKRCPICRELLPGPYHLGRRCNHCQYRLNEWLFKAKSITREG